jgi:hypothetical protein
MDCDFENLLICKRKLKKNGVTAYRTVMEESVSQADDYGIPTVATCVWFARIRLP